MSISQVNPDDYQNALRKLQQSSPVSSRHLLDLVGQKPNGSLILVPGSYEKGYFDSLVPPANRPRYAVNLGIIGQISDGAWVFPPSYDAGMRDGINDLKSAILAEGIARLMRAKQEIETVYLQITKQLEELRAREVEIAEELKRLSIHSQS